MSTPFDLFDVEAPTGSKVVAALFLPASLVTGAATTIAGGTVSGTASVPAGSTVIYLGLTETPASSGLFSGSGDIAGTILPDATTRPYTVQVKTVAGGTVMTTYSTIASAYAASTDVVYTRDIPPTLFTGLLASGAWVSAGSGGAGGTDFTASERAQIRYRFGIDGTAEVPLATPNLGAIGGGTGDGDRPVDHDYGGIDALQVLYAGVGADNARIIAYLKSDYDMGNTAARRGVTYTGPDGRWLQPLMLNSGAVYKLTIDVPGVTQTDVVDLEVT
jgi:hypothetical protein